MCVSLDETEPIDSVLTFPSGYDTLEYSWVKATAVSVHLQIYLCRYEIPTSFLAPLPGNGSYIIYGLSRPCIFIFLFLSFLSLPLLPMEQPIFSRLSYPPGEFWKTSSSSNPFLTASGEPRPAFIAMVRTRLFSGTISEDPGNHLRVFEGLCSSLVIPGMTQEAVRWKLFPSLSQRGRSNGTPAR